jgi:putative regulator of septum formation
MNSWVLRIGIIVLIVAGGFLLRDRLSSNAGDLQVGDCFDDPHGATEIKDVQHHPCSESHTAEVVFLGKMTGDNASYPADATVETWVRSNCLPAWETYTGKTFETEPVLTVGFYQPTSDGWSKGDRDVICYAMREDSAAMTGSVKKP